MSSSRATPFSGIVRSGAHQPWPDTGINACPNAILDGRWVETAHAQQWIVTRRSGPLTAALHPYPCGHIMANFGPGEVESARLDR